MQRHRYYLAQQEKNKEEGQQDTTDPPKDEEILESCGCLIEDANSNATLLIDWWLEGLRPDDFDNQQKEVGSFEGVNNA